MAERDDTTVSTNPLRSRMVRAAMAVGAVAVLVLGAIGAQRIIANAAGVAPGTFQLAYGNGNAVAPQLASAANLGSHDPNAPMTIELSVNPSNAANIPALMKHLYTKGDKQYRHWLTPAQFRAQFAPQKVDTSFLTSRGLKQVKSSSPYILRFTGTTKMVAAAFRVSINNYKLANGSTVYGNAQAPSLPLTDLHSVQGVLGLNTVTKMHSDDITAKKLPGKNGKPIDYGGGVEGTGLTPSQIQGLYLAAPLYASTRGSGKTLAVFELSSYTASDIAAYDTQYHITPAPTLQDVLVDGGPGSDHSGAIEVNLDIELQEALAPGISKVQVYNAPNTDAGVVDEYAQIANDNTADSISTSWGLCEALSSSSVWDSEFTSFEQMAVQGQSIFAAAGDAGAFDCGHDFGNSGPYPAFTGTDQVDDPASNPYITAVGGTSFFGTYDPGTATNPTYPTGKEYVWNTVNNCSNQPDAFFGQFCPFGAGGGGDSRIWARPSYQTGFPGVANSYSRSAPWCSQPSGTACREVPDVSINADPNSGYSEYCTDVDGGCDPSDGWFQEGGTSAAAPLWAAIAALSDAYGHDRVGFINWQIYTYSAAGTYKYYFHDLTGGGTFVFDLEDGLGPRTFVTNSNGCGNGNAYPSNCPAHSEYPELTNYDQATGIGSPRIYYIAQALK